MNISSIINSLLVLTPSIIATSLLSASIWDKKYLIFILFFAISSIINVGAKYMTQKLSFFKIIGQRPDQCGFKYNNICTGCGAIPSNKPGKSWGMPSGHAQSMTFITVYWMMYLYCTYKNEQTTENRNKLVIISIILIITTLLVILQRVHSKCHSILQVVTGSILGSILAVISYILSNRMNDKDFPILHGSIIGTVGTILGSVLGIVIYILSSHMNNQYFLIY